MQVRKPTRQTLDGEHNDYKVLKDIHSALRQRISFGHEGFNQNDVTLGLVSDNIDGVFAKVANSGFPNTQFAVDHTLARVPIGFLVIRQDDKGSFYDGGTDWTDTEIFLKCDGTGVAATFFIF